MKDLDLLGSYCPTCDVVFGITGVNRPYHLLNKNEVLVWCESCCDPDQSFSNHYSFNSKNDGTRMTTFVCASCQRRTTIAAPIREISWRGRTYYAFDATKTQKPRREPRDR